MVGSIMLKAERDNAINRLGDQDRLVFRRIVDALKEAKATNADGRFDGRRRYQSR